MTKVTQICVGSVRILKHFNIQRWMGAERGLAGKQLGLHKSVAGQEQRMIVVEEQRMTVVEEQRTAGQQRSQPMRMKPGRIVEQRRPLLVLLG